MIILSPARRLATAGPGASAAALGLLAAWHYARLGLTLSHYDARGHLVVARRILDSLTPGWQQIGAVWLPLPHLLNALPVQFDPWYQTGAFAVAVSVVSFAIATSAVAWIAVRVSGTQWAALPAAAVLALNPNVLYLQATPMTEPLLLGLTTLAIALLMQWNDWRLRPRRAEDLSIRGEASASVRGGGGAPPPVDNDRRLRPRRAEDESPRLRPAIVGWVFALACLTRFEAWPVTACALAAACWVRWRAGVAGRTAAREVISVAIYPLAAIGAFMVFSRIVVGRWFVSEGFFVAENKALHHPALAAAEIWWGVRELSSKPLLWAGIAGAAFLLARAAKPARAGLLVPLSLVATAALPWAAFVQGHPYRIRYMVPLIAAQAVGVGALSGLFGRARSVAAVALSLVTAFGLRPLDSNAAMIREAQWDRPNVAVRQPITDYLAAQYRGETVMASMGSLGHYMQELSDARLSIRDFLHEGNGDIWLSALEDPHPYAGWVLVEEKAQGGDILARLARGRPAFLSGYSRVMEGAGVALYRRRPAVAEAVSAAARPNQNVPVSR